MFALPSQQPRETASHLSSALPSSRFPGALTEANEQGCLCFSGAAASAHTLGRDGDPTQTRSAWHQESSAGTRKARCVYVPCPQASCIRRKQACKRNPDGVSCPVIRNLILALLTLGLERRKPVMRQTRLGRGRGTLIATFTAHTPPLTHCPGMVRPRYFTLPAQDAELWGRW